MWAHYGSNCKGFCLEFLTDKEPFTKIKKVKYSSKIPMFDMIELVLKGDSKPIFDLFCAKSKAWEYEKEWRLFHSNAGTLYNYHPQALKAVYFGPEIDSPSLEIVCLILSQNPNVEFWRGKRSEKEFQIKFTKFTPTSCIDIKI
jgi:hypothetical protein